MARDLNLKLEWVSADAARVSWNDAYPMWNNRVATVALAAVGTISMAVAPFLVFGWTAAFFWAAAIAGVGGYACFLVIFRTYSKPNAIEVTATKFCHGNIELDRATISRVEYGPRSQWTGDRDKLDPMEIRIWLNDRRFHVVSTNTWQPQVNHEIAGAIEDAFKVTVERIRKVERQAQHGTENEYGMPDY